MASLNIRRVDAALLKELKVRAAQNEMTLRDYVVLQLGGGVDGKEKLAEKPKSSVGAGVEVKGSNPKASSRTGRSSRTVRRIAQSGRAPREVAVGRPHAPDPNFRKKCERETCRHEKVYHVRGLCQLCDGGTSLHEFQEAEE